VDKYMSWILFLYDTVPAIYNGGSSRSVQDKV